MKLRIGFFALAAIVAALSFKATLSAGDGFDALGYNRTALLFNGPADGTDGTIDGLLWGDATYAADKLKMNWSSEWQRGNDEGWSNPPYAKAVLDNSWNGKVKSGSGETWHYKFVWVGTDLANSPYWRTGGYPIWGQFEVIFSHGTSGNQHFWDAHARPAGFGASNQ